MVRRRKEPRNLCAELLEIHWTDANAAVHKEFVSLEDIAATGICFGSQTSLEPGTHLSIFYPKGKYEGRVCYCNPDPLGYLVGVQFDPGYRWSPRQFRPSHLLQFRLRMVQDVEKT